VNYITPKEFFSKLTKSSFKKKNPARKDSPPSYQELIVRIFLEQAFAIISELNFCSGFADPCGNL
jgi:hypothetical protein